MVVQVFEFPKRLEPLLHTHTMKDSDLDAERLKLAGCTLDCSKNLVRYSEELDLEIEKAKKLNTVVIADRFNGRGSERPLCTTGERWTKKTSNFGFQQTGAVNFLISCDTLWEYRTRKSVQSADTKKAWKLREQTSEYYKFSNSRTESLQISNCLHYCYVRLRSCLNEQWPHALDSYVIYDANRQFVEILPRTDDSTPYSWEASSFLAEHYPTDYRYCSYAQHLAITYASDEELHYIGEVADIALSTLRKISVGASFKRGQSRDSRLFRLGKLMERWKYKIYRERDVIHGKLFDHKQSPKTKRATEAASLDAKLRRKKILDCVATLEREKFLAKSSGRLKAAPLAREIHSHLLFSQFASKMGVDEIAKYLRENESNLKFCSKKSENPSR